MKKVTHISSPVTIFTNSFWLNLGNLFSNYLTVFYSNPYLVILQYMQYPSDKNFHAFKNALKWNASAKALWQQLLESHESAITLNIFRHLLCLFRVKGWPICVFCIFDGLCARQKLFSTHCIIRYLIPTNLPSCSKNLHYWMTVFCATFYISFNFFNFLNPFANSLILWTVNLKSTSKTAETKRCTQLKAK